MFQFKKFLDYSYLEFEILYIKIKEALSKSRESLSIHSTFLYHCVLSFPNSYFFNAFSTNPFTKSSEAI